VPRSRRALDLGIPLSEFLRRGLVLALSEGQSQRMEAREDAKPYPADRVKNESRDDPVTAPTVDGPREVLARTAGALRHYGTWMAELDALRGQPPRAPWWTGRVDGA
jgi:hypothetical protein